MYSIRHPRSQNGNPGLAILNKHVINKPRRMDRTPARDSSFPITRRSQRRALPCAETWLGSSHPLLATGTARYSQAMREALSAKPLCAAWFASFVS